MWSASVLSLYVPRLKAFAEQRDAYYRAYATGDYVLAEKLLLDIQQAFGFSIWLFGNRLKLLQATEGLQAQKNFLEEILSTDGIDTLCAWTAFFLSMNVEDNVSYSRLEDEIGELIQMKWVRDYVILHLLPLGFTSIADPGSAIAVEETHPIIDRFETFVAMALSYCTKCGKETRPLLVAALEQVEEVGDSTVRRMLEVLRGVYSPEATGVTQFADAYTEGRYEEVIESTCENLELVARAHCFRGNAPAPIQTPSLRDQVIKEMYNVSARSPDANQSTQTLKKLALICPERSITLQVAAFLGRGHDHMATSNSNDLELASALCNALNNPWSAAALDRVNGSTERWLVQLLAAHPSSSSLRLRLALVTRNDALLQRGDIPLPSYRRAMYLGHVYRRAGHTVPAAINYLIATQSEIEFVSLSAKRYLCYAYYENGQLYEAAQLAIDQVLAHPSAGETYPLEDLAKKLLLEEIHRDSMDLAVLLHLAIRHCNAKLEGSLSNVYENLLESESVSRPSDLVLRAERFKTDRFVYFLRYVCVPRILDDTTHFESVEEIESERIAVCQALLHLDPENVADYQDEIRAITRDSEVASLLNKIQTSKIYVDEAGIRESIEPALNDSLIRYQKLLSSPGLKVQADSISKLLNKIVGDKAHPEFKDLRLPATELEGLFHGMLAAVITEFALNPAYGLDTHLSTSIRHGAFEGHLRSPLAVEDLLCLKQGKDRYILSSTWRQKLPDLGKESFEILEKQLTRFTQRFEDIVHEYLKEKLHIRLVGGAKELFDFHTSYAETQSLMDAITSTTSVNDLADRLIAHSWNLTTRALGKVRVDLLTVSAAQMRSAFDGLVRGVESKIPHESVTPLIDAIARARTAFQVAIEDVANWFHRPTDLSRDPFDIDVAVQVALQQIENCYVERPIYPTLNLDQIEKIDGRMLDGFCEILFILLQNVIRHGGLGEQRTNVTLSTRRENNTLILECTSPLATEISLTERRDCAVNAAKKYERDSALKMAREEGGSGLSKVWRIAEFDLRVKHEIDLRVTDDREFIVRLSLGGIWV